MTDSRTLLRRFDRLVAEGSRDVDMLTRLAADVEHARRIERQAARPRTVGLTRNGDGLRVASVTRRKHRCLNLDRRSEATGVVTWIGDADTSEPCTGCGNRVWMDRRNT